MAKVTRCIFRSKRCERPRGERGRNPACYNDDIFSPEFSALREKERKKNDAIAARSRPSRDRAFPLLDEHCHRRITSFRNVLCRRNIEHGLFGRFDLQIPTDKYNLVIEVVLNWHISFLMIK